VQTIRPARGTADTRFHPIRLGADDFVKHGAVLWQLIEKAYREGNIEE